MKILKLFYSLSVYIKSAEWFVYYHNSMKLHHFSTTNSWQVPLRIHVLVQGHNEQSGFGQTTIS